MGSHSPTQQTLERMREIQAWNATEHQPSPGATAPDYCLAAARFLVGKLVGLFPPSKHLNDFLASNQAKGVGHDKLSAAQVTNRFGHANGLDVFNKEVLPAAIAWAGLRDGSSVEYVQVWHNAKRGHQLLEQGVPLVVGVSLSDTGSRDHFITLAPNGGDEVWAVDSWGSWRNGSVVKLPMKSALNVTVTVEMNAGETHIPCGTPYIGFYSNGGTPMQVVTAL
jgi:hypothetical protein